MDPIETTSGARFRKLGLSVLALACVTAIQWLNGGLITWPVTIAFLGITWAFVSADTLDKAFQSGALGKLKEKTIGRLP